VSLNAKSHNTLIINASYFDANLPFFGPSVAKNIFATDDEVNCYIFSDNPFGLKHQMAHRKYRRFFVIRFAVSPKDTIFALYSHTF